MSLYQILAYNIHGKKHKRAINLKYQLQNGMKNSNYIIDHILYQIFKIILSIYLKIWRKDYQSFNKYIYINKTGNRITFEINPGYNLELLTPETMKLLGSTKSKIAKDEHGKNVGYLEITEVVLVHCNIANNNYQQHSLYLLIKRLNICYRLWIFDFC